MNSLRGIAAMVVLGVVASMPGCGGDTGETPPHLPPSPQFQDLSQKWHVLNNFELAHNRRNMPEYDKLIDVNYTFFFDTIKNGSQTTIQWGRPDEITATSGLLNNVDKIHLELVNLDKPSWSAMIATDNSGETWYTTTLYYSFIVKLGATELISVSPAQMSFTVRNAGTADKPQWRLVELRDDAHVIAPPPPTVAAALHTEQTTYGKMKSGM